MKVRLVSSCWEAGGTSERAACRPRLPHLQAPTTRPVACACAGEGSIFALLKARGLASSLVAGESGASILSASFFYVR